MASTPGKNILITGAPGVGKTTLIRRLVKELAGVHCAGFYTAEIRERGVRKGFELNSLDGRKGMLAHVAIQSPHRVGRYGVDVIGFEHFLDTIGLALTGTDLVIIDEIGKMEIFSKKFNHLLDTLFASERPLVATIATRGAGVIQRIKKRENVTLFEVTRSNRDGLVWEIAALARRC